MKNFSKMMAIMPMVASILATMSAFAATGYKTSEEDVTYRENGLTQDYDNTADETKVDVLVTQASTFTVSIPKRIVLNGAVNEKNDADYVVKVAGNIASDEIIHVTPASTFKMRDDKGVKADLDTTVTQTVTKFVNEAAKPAKYADATDTVLIKNDNANDVGTISGNVEVHNLTSGSWTGVFNFDIKLETVTF